MKSEIIYHTELGITGFKESWDLQKQINAIKQREDTTDIILTTQHRNVYTLGKSGSKDHLLLSETLLMQNNIEYIETDRGGDLTYHGPGQLVCYPIFDLKHYYLDSHRFLRDLEKVIISTLKENDIQSYSDEEYTGVWVDNEKICAIGIKISKWITMHGLALNINNDLTYFDNIIPCGIIHRGVTSIQKVLNQNVPVESITKSCIKYFSEVFNRKIETKSLKELERILGLT